MRRVLDALYDGAARIAALSMVGTLLAVLAGIVDRYFNLNWRGTDMYAGYAMAGAGFLALAHTLKKGEHIRVTLILQRLSERARHRVELFALAVASLLAAAFAFYAVRAAWQSWDFHDVSTGNDATPLWLPQLSMAIGAAILFVAFVDELVLEARGRRVVVESDEALHNE